MKKILVFFIAVAMIACMFVGIGCKSTVAETTTATKSTGTETTAATEGTGTETTAAAESTAAGEPVTITYWSIWNEGEDLAKAIQQIADNYMAENPNVTVVIKWQGRDALTKLSAALKAGVEKPDIAQQGFQRLDTTLVQNDLALPLDKYMEEKAYGEDVPYKDIFLSGMFDYWKNIWPGGSIYSVPLYMYTTMWWYNQAELEKYGIAEAPKDWDTFLSNCETIKSQGGAPLILDMYPEYISYYVYWLTYQLAGRGELVMASLDPKGTGFDNPAFLTAAQKMQELVDKGYFVKGYEGYQFPAGQLDWTQGKGTFILNGSWLLTQTKKDLPEGFIPRGFPFPTVDGKGSLTDVEYYHSGFSILKDTKYPDVCADFIKYTTTEESQKIITGTGSEGPVRKGIATFKDVEDYFNSATTSHFFMDNLQGVNAEWYLKVFNPLNQQLITGDIKAEGYISEIKQQTIDFWAGK